MISIAFVDQQKPASPRRFAVVTHTHDDGTEKVAVGYGNDDFARIASALARLCLDTPRIWRKWRREFTAIDWKLRRETHLERVAANVRAKRAATLVSGGFRRAAA